MSFLATKWLLPLLLVCIGSIMLFVLWRIHRRGQQALHLIDQIHALNGRYQQDLLCFLEHLPALLEPLEDFAGLEYSLHWYGQPTRHRTGHTTRYCCAIPLSADDVQLSLQLYWRRKPVGERLLFQEVLLRTITLIMQMNVLLKQQAQSQAQQQATQAMLFIRHDIKNLAQFIGLQNDMLARSTQQPAEKMLARITQSSQLAQQQADEILLRLQTDSTARLPCETIDLASACLRKAEAFGLTLSVHGQARVLLPPSVLDRVLENLYANAMQHAGVDRLQLVITAHDPQVEATLTQTVPISSEHLLRLFEPLFSATGEPGRGIGLYQCRALLRRYHGDMLAASDENGGQFTLRLVKA